MESKNFIRGKQATDIQLERDMLLIRGIDVKPVSKSKIIKLNDDDKGGYDIKDFGGFHPGIVEIINVGPKVKELSEVEPGDVCIISERAYNAIIQKQVSAILCDGEIFFVIFLGDIVARANYYRENVKEGKIIKSL